MAFGGPTRLDPIAAAWNTVASYPTYEQARDAVDRLSDDHFPVEHLDIVGSDLRLVEHVTGRLTNRRAASAGAAGGAWFGLFIGILVGLFTTGPAWIGLIVGGLVIGAVWGAIFGYLGHAATRGRRDFSSTRSFVAARYDIIARGGHAERAREMLRAAGLDLGATEPRLSLVGRPPTRESAEASGRLDRAAHDEH